MAQNGEYEISLLGAIDIRRVSKGGTGTKQVSTPANFASVSDMRTRLAAISGSYYTAARLDQMTVNDMVYAIRLNDEAAGVR